jgi:hypothetical protein
MSGPKPKRLVSRCSDGALRGRFKCEGISGNAQKACLDQADATRDMTMAKAEAAKAGHT